MTGGQGKIGVVYEPGSVNLLRLVASVAQRWSLVWILDGRTGPVEAALLARVGKVVDIAGLDPTAAAERVGVESIGGLTTFADGCLVQTAELAAAVGVPGNPVHTARCFIDKLAERRALAAHDVPVPAFCGLEADATPAETADRLGALRYPAVVKPAVGVGGRNVLAVLDLQSAIDEVKSRRGADDRDVVIVEECIGTFPPATRDGVADYLSVEMVTVDGRHQLIAVTGRMPVAYPFRETGAFVPALVSDDEYDAVRDMAFAAADALGVVVGCLHVEIKLTPAGPRVIEVNGRSGGGGIPQILTDLGAANPFYCAVAAAMGEDPKPVPPRYIDRLGYAFAIQPPLNRPSRLAKGWRERLKAIPGVSRIDVRAEEWTARQSEGAYNYMALIGGTVSNKDELVSVYDELNQLIEPI